MMKNLLIIVLAMLLSTVIIAQELSADDRVTITQTNKSYIGVYAFGYQGLPNSGYPQFQLNNYGGIPGTPEATTDNSILGMFAFSGHNGSAKKTVGVIRVKSMDDFATSLSSRMDFLLGPNRQQRMTILGDSGRVGVNTEDPLAQMHVVDSDGIGTATIYGESTSVGNSSKVAVRGKSINNPGYGVGGAFEGGNQGAFGIASGGNYSGISYGLFGYASGTAGTRIGVQGQGFNPGGNVAYGIYGLTTGAAATNYGVYGMATGGTTNWAGYFNGNTFVKDSLFVDESVHVNSDGTRNEKLVVMESSSTNAVYISNSGTSTSMVDGNGMAINANSFGIDISMNEDDLDGSHSGFFLDNVTSTSTELSGSQYGMYIYTSGRRTSLGGNFSIYSQQGATSGSGTNWAGYFSGNVRITGTLDNTSDVRLKKDIEDMENALNIIRQLQPKTYEFRTEEYPHMALDTRPQLGFIAQDVEEVLPQLVRTAIHPEFVNDNDGESDIPNSPAVDVKSINYIGIIPVLTQGIKELSNTIDEKEKVIEELIKDNSELKSELAAIKEQMAEMASLMNEKFNQIEEDMSSHYLNGISQKETNTNVELNGSDIAKLEQNAPNPFNEKALITYYIPSFAQKATMTITDIKGTPIKSISIRETGLGTITISANELPIGTYTYTLYVDGQRIGSKQMILLK